MENGQNLAGARGSRASLGWLSIQIFSEQEGARSKAVPEKKEASGPVLNPRDSRENLNPEAV